jgi:hypothetical protein
MKEPILVSRQPQYHYSLIYQPILDPTELVNDKCLLHNTDVFSGSPHSNFCITTMWTLIYSHYLYYLFSCDAVCFDLS